MKSRPTMKNIHSVFYCENDHMLEFALWSTDLFNFTVVYNLWKHAVEQAQLSNFFYYILIFHFNLNI